MATYPAYRGNHSALRLAIVAIVSLFYQVSAVRGDCTVQITQIPPLNGGHRYRATATSDTDFALLGLTLQIVDSTDHPVFAGPSRECVGGTCTVETEWKCLPPTSANVLAAIGTCREKQPLTPADSPPPSVDLDGSWLNEQFEITVNYDIRPGNGFVYFTIQSLDAAGQWRTVRTDPTGRIGTGVVTLFVGAEPGMKFRIRAAPDCGLSGRDDMVGLSGVLEVPNQNHLELVAQNLTMKTPPESKTISGTGALTVPLGTRFSLGIVKVQGASRTELASDFQLGPLMGLESPLADPTSYPATVLLEFDDQAVERRKIFQAVHLGTQNVVITSDPPQGRPQIVRVDVVRPLRLGDRGNNVTFEGVTYNLDDLLVTWTHKHGMPPQVAKAIVQHETLPFLNVMTYRYEPLSTDYLEFSPRGGDDRRDFAYQFVRMEYDSFPRGVSLVNSEDVHPRSKFNLDKTTTPKKKIPDEEQMVTAKTIYDNNDYWQNWSAFIPAERAERIRLNPDLELGWTAQTTIAASYGLMQVLYSEAFKFGGGVINGRRRPFYLFDRPEHVTVAGAGSIPVGTALWAFKFRIANGIASGTDLCAPPYKTPEKMDEKIQRASYYYNGSVQYGKDIMEYQMNYLPVPKGPMLP